MVLVEMILYAMGSLSRSDWIAFEFFWLLNIINESRLRVQSAEKLESGSIV